MFSTKLFSLRPEITQFMRICVPSPFDSHVSRSHFHISMGGRQSTLGLQPLNNMAGEDIAVTKFREYLRVNTEQPNPDYEGCKDFLFRLADELGIARTAVYSSEKTPFVIMTIPGAQPEKESLVLYSHTDVVPTFRDFWTHDPYSAFKDTDGKIYARGAQDMKCVGSQYFEAIRRHFLKGKKQWNRTIHLVWGPDEEIGGPKGMKAFSEMEDFQKLNIGFMLDEGIASETDIYKVFYAERCPWWCKVICEGSPGHGSKFIENNAGEKLQSVINSALAFRESEKKRMEENNLPLGDVISLNLTMVQGGVQINVLPEKLTAFLDIRVPPTVDFDQLERTILGWCTKAGPGVSVVFTERSLNKNITTTSPEDPWWAAFEGALKEEGCQFTKEIFPASTDSRFLRQKGYRSIGFSPMINTPSLLHDHNEYLEESVFLRGVAIYETLIDRIASI